MSNHAATPEHKGIARVIRVAAIPIILAWVVLVVVLNALVPSSRSSDTSTLCRCRRRTHRRWWR